MQRSLKPQRQQRYLQVRPFFNQTLAVVYQSAFHVVSVTERVQIPSASPVFSFGNVGIG